MRMQVLAELRKRRAVGMDELLASLVGFGSRREAVLSLACAGIVRIDLNSGPIGPLRWLATEVDPLGAIRAIDLIVLSFWKPPATFQAWPFPVRVAHQLLLYL
jgi:hypothetical protein